MSDVYGAVDDTYGYYDNSTARGSGISVDDMSVISYAYETGATVVAEMELFNSNLDSTIYSQLASLCGVKPTGWVGRYVFDLQDFTDVPDWAPPMYERQEGVEWQFSGPGIILVSADKIIVLEQKTDFESKNLLQIYINNDYKKEFKGCDRVNFYNWFEIVEPNNGCEVIANFEFDVNATGMEKLKGVLTSTRFAAISRKNTEGKAPVYYFAGDFNDYVNHKNYNRFLFADTVYRWIAFDRQGDISNFFWNFYDPLMVKILSDIEPHENDGYNAENHGEIRVTDDGFQLISDETEKIIGMNTVSINAVEPGENEYSRNYGFYESLIEYAVKIGADCIYAKDILPPEFYRAVFANNSASEGSVLYVMQNVVRPENMTDDEWQKKLKAAVDILHGKGSFDFGETTAKYFIDLTDYVVAINVDIRGENGTHKGTYASGNGNAGPAAFTYDTIQSYAKETYGDIIPIGVSLSAETVKGTAFSAEDAYSLTDIITDKNCLDYYSFLSVSYGDINRIAAEKNMEYEDVIKELNQASGKRLVILC